MRKNRFLILIALVLVFAMLAVTIVGCQKEEGTPSDNNSALVPDDGNNDNEGGNNNAGAGGWSDGDGSSTSGGSTYNISDADAYISFDVIADSASDIAVTDNLGKPVEVTITLNDGVYTVWAPNGGYGKGSIYKITLSNGATFVKYEGVSVVRFGIGNSANNIKINSGFITYPEKAIQDKEMMESSEKTDGYGVTTGQMVLQINSANPLEEGTIFLIEKEDGTQSAYKVVSSSVGGMQAGNCLINYVKPELSEVFEEFQYSATSKLTADSDVDFDYMGGIETLDNSELAMSIFSMFGSKPEFDISVPEFDKDGHVVVDITITIPNVVTVEGYASSDLVITVHNVMDVTASANIDKATVADEFSLKATVKNDITTTVKLGADGGYTGAVNVPELMDKLVELANKDKDDATAIPLFQWTVPIANGVASITYNADLLFRFSVAGDINASAHAQLDYEVGVMYTKADGFDAYANELDGNGFDSVQVALGGQAELKVGLRQDLSFDILAGVLGIGIEAEIGNYNRLYGYGESSNLVDEAEDYFAGGVYFEGGFYYDVNLSYGLKIGNLLNLSDKVDIVDGEIKGYEAGERYLVLGVGAEVQSYTLSALNTNVPAIYYKNMYDLVTKARYTEVAAAEEFTFESASSDLAIENNVIKVTKDINDTKVTATLVANPDLKVDVAYKFTLADPILDNDTIAIDKSSYTSVGATLEFGINYNGFANAATTVTSDDVTISVIDKTANKATVSVPVKELLLLDNGMNEIKMSVGGKALTLNLDVTGSVSWNQFATGANSYSIFTADQVIDMINANTNFEGNVITLTEDIDMKGAEIAPIAAFNGTLQGNGKAITNYTVNAFAGEKAGFVAVNNGTIDNVVFGGNVNVALEATTGKDYAVAGIAAVNNGTITGCAVTGDVNVYSYGLAAFVDFDVAAVAAINNSNCDLTTNVGASALTNVKVTIKFDLANVSVRIGDTTSTTNKVESIVESVVCENCAANGPYATKVTIAK